MSGFAAVNGEPDGAPLLPPIALTDEVAALVAAFATMAAVHSGVGPGGRRQPARLAVPVHGAAGGQLPPDGLRAAAARARACRTRCPGGPTARPTAGGWRSSASAESVAARVMRLVGAGDDTALRHVRRPHRAPRRRRAPGGAWIAARPLAEVLAGFEAAEAAIAPVYTIADIAADPHYRARGSVVDVDGVPMPGLVARLSATPGRLTGAAPPLGRRQRRHPAEVGRGMASSLGLRAMTRHRCAACAALALAVVSLGGLAACGDDDDGFGGNATTTTAGGDDDTTTTEGGEETTTTEGERRDHHHRGAGLRRLQERLRPRGRRLLRRPRQFGQQRARVAVFDCDDPHDNEVVHVFDIDFDDFPGEDEIRSEADATCQEEFESYVGVPSTDIRARPVGRCWSRPRSRGKPEIARWCARRGTPTSPSSRARSRAVAGS